MRKIPTFLALLFLFIPLNFAFIALAQNKIELKQSFVAGTYTESYIAQDDTFASKAYPNNNYGNNTDFKINSVNSGSNEQISYLKFDIPRTDPVLQVFLKLKVNNSGAGGFITTTTDNSWSENTLTYNIRPLTYGPTRVNFGRVTSGTLASFDVTSLVDGAGTVSFVMATDYLDGSAYLSSEASVDKPVIEVTYESTSVTPTPTSTPVPVISPTPSAVPTSLPTISPGGWYFPPPGQGLDVQSIKTPEEMGLNPSVINQIKTFLGTGTTLRWALWRNGHLLHVEGNFNQTSEIKSLRKTFHAMTVGAAVKQSKIQNFKTEKISRYQTNLIGKDAEATWWHVITQSSGFDYPGCGDTTDYDPGQMWTYSDINILNLNQGLFKAWGVPGNYNATNYSTLLKQAYFDAIGMRGWSAKVNSTDGIRLTLDLEDMGRLGILAAAGGQWNGQEVIPQWFVRELETKQTAGMQVNYNGCNNGVVDWASPSVFPESPYGYLTWNNNDNNFYPGADPAWAFGRGSGAYMIMWNRNNGIVFAGVGVTRNYTPTSHGVPHIIEANIISNP